MKIGIVVPVFSNFRGAVEMLQSVKTKHEWTPYIADQWRENKPISRAWNDLTRQAFDEGADYVLIVNDDILFTPYTIDTLVNTFEVVDKSVLLVSAINERGRMDEAGGPGVVFNWPQPTEVSTAEHPDFSCFMISEDTLAEVGLFDENFNPAYFEDNDYHYRINLSGHKAICTTAAPYYHYGSVTSSAPTNPVANHQFEANRGYYVNKWGGIPGGETYRTPFNEAGRSFKTW